MTDLHTQIDLWFPLVGSSLPADHGYPMYGALCRRVPELHEADWWGLHTLRGQLDGRGAVLLPKRPRLGIRLPADRIPMVLKLAGGSLDVDGHRVSLGAPNVAALAPAPAVSTRVATIKGAMDAGAFRAAFERQLQQRDLNGSVQVGRRKVIRVGPHTIVGFSCRVSGLSDAASLVLQARGIGGRRRFGCGMFRPSEHPVGEEPG